VTLSSSGPAESRGRAVREIVIYGLGSGALIAALQLVEFRFLVVDRSVQTYGVLVAVLFAAAGVWLGKTIVRRPTVVVEEVPVPVAGPFVLDQARQRELGITPRELEILGLIAEGLSNRQIADRLFVSENTIKSHSSRLFDKLGAQRRTQAVHYGKAARLIP
jgi:DNA-binding CsgD family transcriptional regulator